MPKQNNQPGICAFCGGGPLTREHVFPVWTRDLYPNAATFDNEFVGGESGNRNWASISFDLNAKVVCATCNHGWMAQLEGDAGSIIKRLFLLNETTITQQEQEKLAFWAQKTVLMLNQATPGSIRITQELYDDIYTRKMASRKAMVRIGWRATPLTGTSVPIMSFLIKQIPSVHVHKSISKEVEAQRDEGGFIWEAILLIGPIIFMVVGHNMGVILETVSTGKALRVIQPYDQDIQWPGDTPIEQEGGIDALYQA